MKLVFRKLVFIAFAAVILTAGILAIRAANNRGAAPVAWWKFDEGYGTTVYDAAGSNDGTMTFMSTSTNGAWGNEEECKSGKCLSFDGSDDYVDVGDNITNDTSIRNNGITYSAWIKSTDVADAGIVGLSSNLSNDYYTSGGLYIISQNPVIRAYDNGVAYVSATGDNSIIAGVWYYLVGTYDPTDTKLRIYVNGVLKGVSLTISTLGQGTALDENFVGKNSDSNIIWPFNGKIDDVKIYDYARSAAQIKSDYLATAGGRGAGARVSSAAESLAQSEGLVAYWKMDEALWDGTADEVVDASGNANHGQAVANATTTATAKYGRAGTFDGTGDYVDLGDPAALRFTGSFSISAWVNVDDYGEYGEVVSKGVQGSGNRAYELRHEKNTGYASLFVYTGGSCSSNFAMDTVAIGTSAWHYVTGTYDSLIGTIRIYVDGELRNTTIGVIGDVCGSNGDVHIGDLKSTSSTDYDGQIDDVKIYNVARSASQIRRDYETGPPPVAHWKFDEKSGSSVQDTSGTSTGTLTNMDASTDWVQGKYGSALSFDGSNDYVDINTAITGLDKSGNATFSFWAKNNTITGTRCIFGSTPTNWINVYSVYNSGNIRLSLGWKSWTFDDTGDSPVAIGEWAYYTVVVDTSYLYMYLNGVRIWTSTRTSSPSSALTGFGVGHNHEGNSSHYNGTIDDVRIYNYARTQKQIMEDMNAGHPAVGSPEGSYVGYWKFDEMQGATAYDSSIQANNGTLLGEMATSTAADSGWTNEGKFGGALSFDGTDDYVNISHDSSLNSNIITVSAWVNLDSFSGPRQIVNKQDQGNNKRQFSLSIPSGGNQIDFAVNSTGQGGGWARTDFLTTGNMDTGSWHHIVGLNDGTNVKIYLDGVLKNTDTGISTIHNGDAPVGVGAYIADGGSNSKNLSGFIDEVKIYPFALTPDEVKQEYNRGVTAQMGSLSTESDGTTMSDSAAREYCVPGSTDLCLPPVAHWKFDEKTGTSANDTSTSTNTGTLTNMATSINGGWQHAGNCHSGACLSFDGSDDYVDINTAITGLDKSGNATFSFWAKNNTITGTGCAFGFEPSGYINIYPFYASGNITVSLGWKSWTFDDTGDSPVAIGEWAYYTVVVDTSNLYMYLNGVEIWTAGRTGSPTNENTSLGIGHRHEGDSFHYNGTIDDVRIYNYARTPAQVAWDYNRGGPVGWWKMDEGQDAAATCDATGSTVYDYSGKGNDGTLVLQPSGNTSTSTAWAVGKNNCALDFDGTDDYVDVSGLGTDLNGTKNIGISFWIKNTAGVVAWKNPLSFGDGKFRFETGNPVSNLNIFDSGIDSSGITVGTGILSTTDWTFVAFTSDDTNWYTYVNGVQSNTGTTDAGMDGGSDLFFGQRYVNWGFYKGTIDDVRIYNYALTPTQIRNVYNEGSAVRFGPSSGVP